MKKIAIVGGGIAGLTSAYRIRQGAERRNLPVETTLLEASRRLGGKILSERVGGTIFEGGPDSFMTLKPQALDLILELGIGPDLLATNQDHQEVFVFARGRLRRMPEGLLLMAPAKIGPFLKSDLMSWPGKLRMGLDLILPPRKDDDDESMGAFARRRFGAEALETIVQPIMGGIYAGDADQLSLQSTFPRFQELERKYGSVILGLRAAGKARAPNPPGVTAFMTLSGGLEQLIDVLASRVGANTVQLGASVARVRREKQGWRVETGSGRAALCDAVIISTPAWAAAGMLREMAPDLAAVLREIPFTSTATASFLFESSSLRRIPEGFGFVVRRDESRLMSAGTFTSIKFPGRVPEGKFLIRCFLGAAAGESNLPPEDSQLLAEVREELRRILGIEAAPIVSRLYRWPNANPQYTVGHAARLGRISAILRTHPGLLLSGASYYGVGIPECIASGSEAARAALHYIGAA